jgi:glycosyltransferase involved in cell wall biosynthesis
LRVLAVTHVFPRTPQDPSAPFLLTWARALADAGADVGVIAPHDAGLPDRHEVAGIPIRLPRYAPEGHEWLSYRGEMHRLARRPAGLTLLGGLVTAMASSLRVQARLGKPDVVHVHWWLPGAIVARMADLAQPVVLTVHGTDVALVEEHPPLGPVARWAMAAADRVEAVSTDLAARLQRVTGRAADAVNPMCLDPALVRSPPIERPDHGGPLRILGVGRLVPEKAFADLVSAVALLESPARLVLVGDGPQRDRLEAQARALAVDLRLPGRLEPPALHQAYRTADVVVQSSRREGFGMVVAEALAVGTPVVATDSGGVRDLVDANELVAPGDVAGLAAALGAVARDPASARDRAARAGERIRRRLSPAACAARTLEGYHSLVPAPG